MRCSFVAEPLPNGPTTAIIPTCKRFAKLGNFTAVGKSPRRLLRLLSDPRVAWGCLWRLRRGC